MTRPGIELLTNTLPTRPISRLKLSYPPSNGLNSLITAILQGEFGIKLLTKVDMPLNKDTKLLDYKILGKGYELHIPPAMGKIVQLVSSIRMGLALNKP